MALTFARTQLFGIIAETAGIACVVGGLVLSLHHWPIAVALIGGAAAYVAGKKLRAPQ